MALLQVRDFPALLYTLLAEKAEAENRSITQQTIHMLTKDLTEDSEAYFAKANRMKALNAISCLNLKLPQNAPSPAELLRADREDSNR